MASQPMSGGDTTCLTYAGCEGGVEVTGCTVQAGGHCWFGEPSCPFGPNSRSLDATDTAWAFLRRFGGQPRTGAEAP